MKKQFIATIVEISELKPTGTTSYRTILFLYDELDSSGNQTGRQSIYQVTAWYNAVGDLNDYKPMMKVDVEVWIISKKADTATYKGYNQFMNLKSIKRIG